MTKLRIGVLCPSEIAFRRFMPSVTKIAEVEYVGVAVANEEEWFGKICQSNNLQILDGELEKAKRFQELYGGRIYTSYGDLLSDQAVDAVYIPLPPALHYRWAKKALENKKHVFVEKPSTAAYEDTLDLVNLASSNGLALHENYMFNFHSQIDYIENEMQKGTVGNVRLFRIAFGFPFRGKNDFRYNRQLGGGALLDCGGYTIKLATRLLGGNVQMHAKQLNYVDGFDVDIFGCATLSNEEGLCAQISFGMDNSYKCELEVWGSTGRIYTNRILTAPAGFNPTVMIQSGNEERTVVLDADDTFEKSIRYFIACISDPETRKASYDSMLLQQRLVEQFWEK